MAFVTAVSLLPLVAVLIYAFVMFDRLLRAEYRQHRVAWVNDGRPAGFFWRAEECSFVSSHIARARLAFAWLFSTPTWAAGSAPLLGILRRLRLAVLIWNVGFLAWFAIFAAQFA